MGPLVMRPWNIEITIDGAVTQMLIDDPVRAAEDAVILAINDGMFRIKDKHTGFELILGAEVLKKAAIKILMPVKEGDNASGG